MRAPHPHDNQQQMFQSGQIKSNQFRICLTLLLREVVWRQLISIPESPNRGKIKLKLLEGGCIRAVAGQVLMRRWLKL